MTVLDVIRKSTDYLQGKGVEAPRLQVELMLGGLLKIPRLQIYLDFERSLDEAQLSTLRGWLKRRGHREPLQHILGTAPFCGHEFRSTAAALVPRPETEVLVEKAAGWMQATEGARTLIDLGTGTGCVAVSLLKQVPDATGTAIDLSEAALHLARANAEQLEVGGRLEFLLGDLLTTYQGPPVALIISNPPYIPSAEIEQLEPEVRDFDPRAALDGGVDGLDFYRRLAVEAQSHLQPGGRLYLEFGDGQAEALRSIFEESQWDVLEIMRDLSQRQRVMALARSGQGS